MSQAQPTTLDLFLDEWFIDLQILGFVIMAALVERVQTPRFKPIHNSKVFLMRKEIYNLPSVIV